MSYYRTDLSLQHGEMNAGTKLAALNKFRGSASVMMRQPVTKVLVVNDVQVKIPEISHVPLIINYGKSSCRPFFPLCAKYIYIADLPKAVEEYAHRYAPPYPRLSSLTSAFQKCCSCHRVKLRTRRCCRKFRDCDGRRC